MRDLDAAGQGESPARQEEREEAREGLGDGRAVYGPGARDSSWPPYDPPECDMEFPGSRGH